MEVRDGGLARVAGFVHHHLLWFLIAVYALAGLAPAAGLWLRSAGVGTGVSLPAVMLALLLFNAGLGVEPRQLRNLFRTSGVLLAGLAANMLVPLAFILSLSLTLSAWHNPTEVQYILVGLALIASMPVAGSSTAWSQNANGDLALSLGLVVGSTVLSPLTTPAVLHAVGWVAEGTFADGLHRMADGGTSSFLVSFVMAPSLLGIALRCAVGAGPLRAVKPALKLTNSVTLLLLCYANAAVALPKTFAHPDWDFLGVMLLIVASLCTFGFAAGLLLATWFTADRGRRASLMFGLGMTNNGTGLVLATTALAHVPDVMLPVIFYNLVQHVVAAVFQRASLAAAPQEGVNDP
ncbi:bile acid:sodium symporter family protein [Limnoglobus roseus]|uniref:Na+-dependent transporter n=1 Tax=Limnoglobus roseus TaxID=2598579 RepID=A0A5C1AMV0_9BACT|nr:bile acid:sodium symporter [Limnoglobus roseus]QEL19467.1 Na+-dependent transporter [Limnoglobus roseus]